MKALSRGKWWAIILTFTCTSVAWAEERRFSLSRECSLSAQGVVSEEALSPNGPVDLILANLDKPSSEFVDKLICGQVHAVSGLAAATSRLILNETDSGRSTDREFRGIGFASVADRMLESCLPEKVNSNGTIRPEEREKLGARVRILQRFLIKWKAALTGTQEGKRGYSGH